MRLQEISPNTVKGSWSKDLVLRKLWALTELKKIKDNFDTVYILGSWYGNTSIILSLLKKHFHFDRIVNVDTDKQALDKSKEVIQNLRIDADIKFDNLDANKLDYRGLGNNGLVINTSASDIEGEDWLKNIPTGTIVLIQSRNLSGDSPNQFDSLEDLFSQYPLSKIFYKGEKRFKDPETEFNSFMIIGQK